MTAISEFIVYLWLAPVTLFVVLPLALTLIRSLVMTVSPLLGLFTIRSAGSWDLKTVRY